MFISHRIMISTLDCTFPLAEFLCDKTPDSKTSSFICVKHNGKLSLDANCTERTISLDKTELNLRNSSAITRSEFLPQARTLVDALAY